jgi:hypothetical protein
MTAIVLRLIVLHSLGGHEVAINPAQVTSLHAKADDQNRLLADEVTCVVGLTDGKFVSVTETCAAVRAKIEELK